MTDYYVWDGATFTDGLSWAGAYETILAAATAVGDDDTIYVASDHVETQTTNLIIAFNYTVSAKARFISTKRSDDSFETMEAGGGSISTTGAGDIYLTGRVYLNGLYFNSGDDITFGNASSTNLILENSKIALQDIFAFGHATHTVYFELINTTISIATTGYMSLNYSSFIMRGGSISSLAAMTSTTLFNLATEGANISMTGVDLSGIYANTALTGTDIDRSNIVLARCKLWTGFTIPTPLFPTAGTIKCHSCDTGDGYWYFHEVSYYGAVNQATNCYLNATYDGTNGFSAKMVSSANAKEYTEPLRFKLCEVYAVADATFTVEVITAGVTLQNDEFWIEIASNDATDEAFGDIVDTRPVTILTAPANLTSSSAGWTEDLGSEVKQKIEKTVSGGADGIVTIWACLAKPSTTVYVDPDVVIS